ncbi:MAG TPA: CRISPR-associated protein Cas4, partial [Fimbriimonadaceae bacterium]|nr:CRISPR-associated protein Cas4 [Fimbriimonadaceae bacterium]
RKVLRSLPIWSDEFGLIGKSDAVEIYADRVVPVEYKVGKDVGSEHAALQAVAQAICLREMFDMPVDEVVIYYGASKTRKPYEVTEQRVARVLDIAEQIRQMRAEERLPAPVADKRCRRCSLIDACQPFAIAAAQSLKPSSLFRPRSEARNLP